MRLELLHLPSGKGTKAGEPGCGLGMHSGSGSAVQLAAQFCPVMVLVGWSSHWNTLAVWNAGNEACAGGSQGEARRHPAWRLDRLPISQHCQHVPKAHF